MAAKWAKRCLLLGSSCTLLHDAEAGGRARSLSTSLEGQCQSHVNELPWAQNKRAQEVSPCLTPPHLLPLERHLAAAALLATCSRQKTILKLVRMGNWPACEKGSRRVRDGPLARQSMSQPWPRLALKQTLCHARCLGTAEGNGSSQQVVASCGLLRVWGLCLQLTGKFVGLGLPRLSVLPRLRELLLSAFFRRCSKAIRRYDAIPRQPTTVAQHSCKCRTCSWTR